MCGIAGILLTPGKNIAPFHLQKMTDALAHRGPDGEGHWVSTNGNVHLGHRRLSIIDLSDKASQPMPYGNRYQIIHNGEIYNYEEIRTYLQQKGYSFNSKSDTEVIVAAYDYWKEKCLQKFDGMFAFAIWDNQTQQLFAARDRFGEKPFYYYEDEEHFIFASEMKALWAIGIEKNIDKKMMLNYLTLGHVQNCVDKEQTFFESIYSLPPAHYLKYNSAEHSLKVTPYWRINKETEIEISETDAIEKFTELFNISIKRRLRTDVPIGSCLSGGLDSSSIVALVNQQQKNSGKSNAFQSFSAVFPGFENDEASHIKQATDFLKIKNSQVEPNIDDLINQFEKICFHQEEPFQSASIFAQYKLYELAIDNDVKVLLDGQGADETLAGYPRYIHWFLQETLSRHRLGATSHEKKAFVKNKQPFNWNYKNIFAAFLPSHAAIRLEKLEYSKTISQPDIHPDFLHQVNGRAWEGIHKPIITKLNDILHFNSFEMGLEELLRFGDRNSMAHGLEVRLPFLNHELVEFIFSLPSNLKMHNGWPKYILRKVMDKSLPNEIVWRQDKVGFEPPQKNWMTDPALQEYIKESKRKLASAGILTEKAIKKRIEPKGAHADKNYDWRYLCAAQLL